MTLSLIRGTRIRRFGQSAHLLRSLLFGLMITLWFSATAHAIDVPGLYQVEIAVSSQQLNERKRASTQALDRVIRRISGNVEALNEPEIRLALQSPERYVQQFSYFVSADKDSRGQQYLRLTFDETLVNRLLRQARQPIWGNNRPSLMMWVAVDGSSNRHLISAGRSSIWQRAVTQAGKEVGVPVLLPLMDLQDESNISIEDVWGLFRDKLDLASQRYRSEAVLGGRVYQTTSRRWTARWLLIFEGEVISFKTEGDEIGNLATDALAQVASILVKHYAIDTTALGNEHIKLAVQGVQTVQDYARVMSYLEQFAMVRDVAVSNVEGERLTLMLTTEGGWSKLKGLIALDKKLQPVSDEAPEFDGDMLVMPYLWRR